MIDKLYCSLFSDTTDFCNLGDRRTRFFILDEISRLNYQRLKIIILIPLLLGLGTLYSLITEMHISGRVLDNIHEVLIIIRVTAFAVIAAFLFFGNEKKRRKVHLSIFAWILLIISLTSSTLDLATVMKLILDIFLLNLFLFLPPRLALIANSSIFVSFVFFRFYNSVPAGTLAVEAGFSMMFPLIGIFFLIITMVSFLGYHEYRDIIRQIYLRKTSIDRLRIIKAQKEELEKMTRNRDRVDQILRHDLKSPLNGIIGTAKLLLNGDIEEGRDELLSMIEQSGFKILHMIDNSLDQYQMEDGTYHLRVEPVDIVKVLEELRGEFASQLTLKELSLDYVFPPDISGQESIVEGEELKLASMLSNLLKNAVEAAPRGSSVQVTLKVERAQDRVNMDIHNMGSIPEEIRPNFFQRYITSGKQHGTGLGTYSAKLIVDVHGGEISFASSEEEGTHLYISLPRRQSPGLPSGDTVRKKITPNIA